VEKGRHITSMNNANTNSMSLYSRAGERLYLSQSERQSFITAANTKAIHVRLFCLLLVHTGCRLTEAVKLTKHDVQISEAVISIRSLKKRNKHHVREIPVPNSYVRSLQPLLEQISPDTRIWQISSITGWRWVKNVMHEAGISGVKATPKGLRHSFGVHAVLNSISLNIIQRWLGHSDISTTAIYAQVSGYEERQLAKRMWE